MKLLTNIIIIYIGQKKKSFIKKKLPDTYCPWWLSLEAANSDDLLCVALNKRSKKIVLYSSKSFKTQKWLEKKTNKIVSHQKFKSNKYFMQIYPHKVYSFHAQIIFFDPQ